MAVDGIIFDFDGVIIDTETPDYELWQDFYRSRGLDLAVDLWLSRVGVEAGGGFKPEEYFEQVTGTPLDADFKRDFLRRYVEHCAQQPILSGVREMIQEASDRRIKLGIASNSTWDWVGRWLRQHDLVRYFECIRTREDVKRPKPAPDLYLSVVDCLGVPIERCLAIEDSPSGMQAALAAGLRCLAVPNPLTVRLTRPDVDLTVNSLADFDLTRLLTRF